MSATVAIVGRPNVGKSTLFNRLIGHRAAIVHDTPGITRDRHYGDFKWNGREMQIIDTGGLEPETNTDLFKSMRVQALAAIEEADIVIFIVDARAGLTPMDAEVARLLRSSDTTVLLCANKVEARDQEAQSMEFYSLGLGEVRLLSAEHGLGVADLLDEVVDILQDAPIVEEEDDDEDPNELRIAVIGRPNIGKSTLVNQLIGEERHVVADMPGTTMDAVDSVIEVDGRTLRFVDTAGIRRKSRIAEDFEGFAVSKAIRSVERCHITLLLIDGLEGPSEQDARLARLVMDRGRGLAILVNKWDLVREHPERDIKRLELELDRRMPHTTWAPLLTISALTGRGVHRILPTIERIYEQFNKRLTTAECNRFLAAAVGNHSVPQRYHRPVRLNFMTQVRVRPPTFVIFSNTPDGIEPSYTRYLTNRLREFYDFTGTPLRVNYRQKRKPGEAKED
jgi:GTPase